MTPSRPAANVFTVTDANGAQVSFDPASGKWSAEWNGKKTSSLKHEVVRDKMVAWKTESDRAATKTTPAEPIELTMLMVGAQDHQLKTTWREGSQLKVVPVQLKVMWDDASGAPKILKYRPLDGNSGWKQFNSDSLLLVDPFNLTNDHQALFVEHLRNRALRKAYGAVEGTLASQWSAAKAPTHQYVTLNGQALAPAQVEVSGRNKPDWRGVFSVSSQWPVLVNADPEFKTAKGWETDKDGAWTKNDGSVRVKLHLAHWGAPSFIVEQRMENTWQPLLQDSSFEVALAVAEATMMLKDNQAVPEWTGSDEWMQRNRGLALYWPKPVATLGALMVSKKTGEETLYMLQRSDPSRAPHLHDGKPSALQWVAQNSSQYASRPASLWPVGPEDAVFGPLAALDQAMGDIQSSADDVQAKLQAFTQETLAQSFGDATNGDAEKHTVEEVQARWIRMTERWSRQIAESDNTKQWLARCDALLVTCAPLFAVTPATKRPKP